LTRSGWTFDLVGHGAPLVTLESSAWTPARAVDEPSAALAVYVHIPFCESLCTFCGCNTVITRDHSREQPYVATVLAELDTYLAAVPGLRKTPVRQIHLGGGTCTRAPSSVSV
jgi:coproporphyrinogen III oxidase-like Fe-S oxidoreductase